MHHLCSLSSLEKSYFCVVKKQNVWAKPQNPSAVSTNKMPLSKFPLGVRQWTLRFRKHTKKGLEVKLENTVMTLPRPLTQQLNTALILNFSIHFVKTKREPFCRALLQMMRSGWYFATLNALSQSTFQNMTAHSLLIGQKDKFKSSRESCGALVQKVPVLYSVTGTLQFTGQKKKKNR